MLLSRDNISSYNFSNERNALAELSRDRVDGPLAASPREEDRPEDRGAHQLQHRRLLLPPLQALLGAPRISAGWGLGESADPLGRGLRGSHPPERIGGLIQLGEPAAGEGGEQTVAGLAAGHSGVY